MVGVHGSAGVCAEQHYVASDSYGYDSIEMVVDGDPVIHSPDDFGLDLVERFGDMPALRRVACYLVGDEHFFTEGASVEGCEREMPLFDDEVLISYLYSKGLEPSGETLHKSQIGKGGFGSVYRATDCEGKVYAVKVFNNMCRSAESSADVEYKVSNFMSLRGQFLPMDGEILLGNDADENMGVLISDYIDGPALNRWRKERHSKKRSKHDSADELFMMEKLVEKVVSLHKNGIVHNDIAPENTIVAEDDVWCIDLGLALQEGDCFPSDGMRRGRLYYMSPERFDQGNIAEVNSDVVSLGRMLFEVYARVRWPGDSALKNMSNGAFVNAALKYGSDNEQKYLKHPDLRHGIRFNSPKGERGFVREVLSKAMHPDPDKRFRDACELLPYVQELRYLAEEPLTRKRNAFYRQVGKSLRKNKGKRRGKR